MAVVKDGSPALDHLLAFVSDRRQGAPAAGWAPLFPLLGSRSNLVLKVIITSAKARILLQYFISRVLMTIVYAVNCLIRTLQLHEAQNKHMEISFSCCNSARLRKCLILRDSS
jgi:hypothetical protein